MDEFSRLALEHDLDQVRGLEEAARWSLTLKDGLEVWAEVSPAGHESEKFLARLSWLEYPGELPASVKFIDPDTGRLDVATAWPEAEGFRPTSFDICATWTAEGYSLHPEWRGDARLRWRIGQNPLLESLRVLQGRLDATFTRRYAA